MARQHVHRRDIESLDQAQRRMAKDPTSPAGLLGTCRSRNCADRVKVYAFDPNEERPRDFRVAVVRRA